MISAVLTSIAAITAFCATDHALTTRGWKGQYYAVHAIHNAIIMAMTAGEVVTSFYAFDTLATTQVNCHAAALVVALHVYHILWYWSKLQMDDWLHHILMVGVALPIGLSVPCGALFGSNLFFTTGLPGGLNYILLFLVRNDRLSRMTQKRINTQIHLWLRAPGCAAQAALAAAYALSRGAPLFSLAMLPSALTLWNGQYFMNQVVRDLARLNTLAAGHSSNE